MKPVFITVLGYDEKGMKLNMRFNVNHIVRYEEHIDYKWDHYVYIHLTTGEEIHAKMSLDAFENCLNKAIESMKL